jgi:TIR domain
VPDVFISYSQPDYDCAHELVARVEAQGIGCWIAPRDISPSADWAAEIIDAITNARIMILVFSASSNDSPQVRREVERAVHKQLSILPFRIENVLPSKSLEYFLSAQHWMDAFPPPREPHYARLCAYLKTHLVAQSAPQPIMRPIRAAAPAHAIGAADMQHVERQLAGFIGPLAKHLVKLAAQRATGLDDLVGQLASELDTESERREFTQRCRISRPS